MCQQTKLSLRKGDQTAVLLCVTNVPASNSRSYISQQISADLMTNHVSLLKHLLQPSPPSPTIHLLSKVATLQKSYSVYDIVNSDIIISIMLVQISSTASKLFWNRKLRLAWEIKARPWLTISNQAFALSSCLRVEWWWWWWYIKNV